MNLTSCMGTDLKASPREISLSVRLEGGDAWCFPYAYLVSASYESLIGTLTLTFSSHEVIVEGKHLGAVYEAIQLQSIQFIQITAGHNIPEHQPDITSIRVQVPTPETE